MNISEQFLKSLFDVFISKMPPDTSEKVGALLRAGLELKAQLDRIETRQAAMEISLRLIVQEMRSRTANDGENNGRIEGGVGRIESETRNPAAPTRDATGRA